MMNMRTLLFLLVFAPGAYAQDISLESNPASLCILPGTPAELHLTITNVSGKSLVLVGTSLDRALTPQGGLLQNLTGETNSCVETSAVTVTSKQPPCEAPTVVFPAGGVLVVPFGIYSQRSCPLDDVPPGKYIGKVWIEAQSCEEGRARPIRQTLEIAVTVKEPKGEDAAYLQALRIAVKEAPPKYSGIYCGALKWMEVLQSHRIQPDQLVLSRYPTSTYAGYALVGKGPASSLQAAAVATNEVRDQMWNVPTAAPKAQQEARRKEIREKYESFLQMAQKFLKVHPDFAREDMLRKEMAIVLFNLERPQEAWLEVEALAKLDGPWADEGRQVLANRKKAAQPANEPAPALKEAPEPDQPATRPKEKAN